MLNSLKAFGSIIRTIIRGSDGYLLTWPDLVLMTLQVFDSMEIIMRAIGQEGKLIFRNVCRTIIFSVLLFFIKWTPPEAMDRFIVKVSRI